MSEMHMWFGVKSLSSAIGPKDASVYDEMERRFCICERKYTDAVSYAKHY